MRQLVLDPEGWPCTLEECRPGFFVFGESLCLKSEYGDCEAFNCAGETFCGGANTAAAVKELIVQPVVANWTEVEI